MSTLLGTFSALSPAEKATFLARVAHEATVYARASYVPTQEHPNRTYDHPDAIILRDANNFVHRVVGYIGNVLTGTEWLDDESMLEEIEAWFRERSGSPQLVEQMLLKWMKPKGS